ncbi:hypothetical protein ACROYT_G041090 [Oculina patagonica]
MREKAKECEFEATFDERILEHIIQTIDNKKMIEKAISKTWDLTRFLTEASQTEDIAREIKDMGSENDNRENVSRVHSELQYPKQQSDGFTETQRPGKKHKCQYCGLFGAHGKGKDCPAYGKKCHKCHKLNHFSSVCKSESTRSHKFRRQKQSKGKTSGRIKRTTENAESTSSDDEFFGQAAEHLKQAKEIREIGKNGDDYRTVMVQLNDLDVLMEAGSGADVNIMDEHQFKAFIHRTHDKPILANSNVKLRTLQHKLEVKGEFETVVRISQAPIVEDIIHKFHDCTIWTKLDLRQGYHQLELHPDSRSVATFSTPWGNFRPKRLVFGAKASQDVFDEAMYRIFGDIPQCLNQRDDILIGASNWKEHNETLESVFQKAEDYGITFNEPKCEFGQKKTAFYGYQFGQGGLRPTPEKVQAIRECKPPRSKSEVRSFLGMTGYLSKFIPRYASLTKPLRELTHKETNFHWGRDEDDAFEELKASISSKDTMAFFKPKLPIMVRVEASYNEGLSAGLFQQSNKGWQPVHFISPYAKLPPRIEKWVMDMQDVDFEMKYEPGKDEADALDFLSRHPLPVVGNNDTEKILKATIETEHAVVLDRIREETHQDRVLQKLSQTIKKGNWETSKKDVDLAPFYPIKDEHYEAQGLIFRMERIVLPMELQQKVIKSAHKLGHLGTTKTKQMIREKYWFPGMNGMINQMIGHCFDCQVTTKDRRQEPIKPSVIPKGPWGEIAVDVGGPYPDGHYNLVAIDQRTRYPEVEVVF